MQYQYFLFNLNCLLLCEIILIYLILRIMILFFHVVAFSSMADNKSSVFHLNLINDYLLYLILYNLIAIFISCLIKICYFLKSAILSLQLLILPNVFQFVTINCYFHLLSINSVICIIINC